MLHSKVLIIGAGAAGIAAASRLIANNITHITILEAEDRIGGRIYTSQFGENTVELGAQWVHGEVNNSAHVLGSTAGLLTDNFHDLTKSKTVFSNGVFVENQTVWKLFGLCREMLHDEENISKFKGSLGDYVYESIKGQLQKNEIEVDAKVLYSFLEWFHRFQNSIDGSDSWFQTSARGTLEYHECEGNSLTQWKFGGYVSIFEILMKGFSEKIKENIIFNKTVKKICWDQQPVEVWCADGQVFTADFVLLTVSLGVLKENISSLFVPSVPRNKLCAIQRIGIGTVDKIFLKFPYRWWPADCPGFSLLWQEDELSSDFQGWQREVFGFYSVDDAPQVLCGWVVGQGARDMELCTDELVQSGCHKLLKQFLGNHYNIPAPESLLRSRWYSNPNFRGSYSFRSVASDERRVTAADLATPLISPSGHPVVLFGGEATHNHFYSTVHGAIETGWREADRLISHLSTELNRLPKSTL